MDLPEPVFRKEDPAANETAAILSSERQIHLVRHIAGSEPPATAAAKENAAPHHHRHRCWPGDENRRSDSPSESMTQDCIEWDESKQYTVDLRKLADPTFQTPRDKHCRYCTDAAAGTSPLPSTASCSRSSSSSRSRTLRRSAAARPSLEAVTRRLRPDRDQSTTISDVRAVQEIDAIFHQLSRRSSSTTNIDNVVANDDSLTPRLCNTGLSKSTIATSDTSSIGGVFCVAGSRKRHRREQQKQQQQRLQPLAAIPEQPAAAPLPRRPSPAAPAVGSTDFDDLLRQIQNPPATAAHERDEVGSDAKEGVPPYQQQHLGSSQPTFVSDTIGAKLPDRNSGATASTAMLFPDARPPPAAVTVDARTTPRDITTAATSKIAAAADGDDEFGTMDLSLDDFATMDSLVVSAAHDSALPAPATATVTAADMDRKNSTMDEEEVYEEADPFGDVPDIDIDALVRNASNNHPDIKRGDAAAPPAKIAPADDDPFVDLPEFDFDALVRKHAKTSTHATVSDVVALAPRAIDSAADDDEFPDIDFDALDEVVAKRESSAPSSIPPPVDAVVRNPRRSAPTHSGKSDDDGRLFLAVSRYKVLCVKDDVSTFTKTLVLAAWTPDMLRDEDTASRAVHHPGDRRRCRPPPADGDASPWPAAAGAAHLRGEWYHTRVAENDAVHIVSLTGRFRTDALPLVLHTYAPPDGSDPDDDLLLIVHPDLLLTPTAISEAVTCNRRAVLKNRLGSTGLTGTWGSGRCYSSCWHDGTAVSAPTIIFLIFFCFVSQLIRRLISSFLYICVRQPKPPSSELCGILCSKKP